MSPSAAPAPGWAGVAQSGSLSWLLTSGGSGGPAVRLVDQTRTCARVRQRLDKTCPWLHSCAGPPFPTPSQEFWRQLHTGSARGKSQPGAGRRSAPAPGGPTLRTLFLLRQKGGREERLAGLTGAWFLQRWRSLDGAVDSGAWRQIGFWGLSGSLSDQISLSSLSLLLLLLSACPLLCVFLFFPSLCLLFTSSLSFCWGICPS